MLQKFILIFLIINEFSFASYGQQHETQVAKNTKDVISESKPADLVGKWQLQSVILNSGKQSRMNNPTGIRLEFKKGKKFNGTIDEVKIPGGKGYFSGRYKTQNGLWIKSNIYDNDYLDSKMYLDAALFRRYLDNANHFERIGDSLVLYFNQREYMGAGKMIFKLVEK